MELADMANGAKTSKSLKEYRAKRDFKKSPEPSGTAKPKRVAKGKPGKHYFCVQKHLASQLHYDFRLEHNGVLLSWAVPKGPSLNPSDKRLAMRVEDHPLEYGDFEGVIPEGYGAGIVMLWDRGKWIPEVDDVDAALKKGDLKFTLEGLKLRGSWVLVRTRVGPKGADGQSRSWLLIKHRDQWAGEVDVTALDKSVKSFGDFADILAAEKPDVWESHRPAGGGEAGAMLREIIEKAAKLKLARSDAKKAKSTTRSKPGVTRHRFAG
ncbi:MAG TPA: DNA polymerase ligase N-terminal domain-containing protein [Tepidisphaeraceae bacterium]|nr:DNA polymerase ligase N-terminal domain-containing protein [Tepidisphaeraceae bacterium]